MTGSGSASEADVIEALAAKLDQVLPDQVARHASMAALTTYRLGGPAAVLVRARHVDEVAAIAKATCEHPVPVIVVGRGSNLLVADRGFPGLALVLEGMLEEVELGDSGARSGGGLALPVLARRAAALGWGGLEFYVGIPGTVGGAVKMNAGGHGCETADVLEEATTIDLAAGPELRVWSRDDLEFSYRHSAIGSSEVVVGAVLRVRREDPATSEARITEIVRWRREHQPGGANGGSIFRNPPGHSAGALVDSCGLKGLRVGAAHVSEKHANFIQADTSATADDVYVLIQTVRDRVESETGIQLVPEIHLVGFDETQIPTPRSSKKAPKQGGRQ